MAFAMLNSVTAGFVQHELADGSQLQQRNLAYLQWALGSGQRPRLARLLAEASTQPGPPQPASPAPADAGNPADRYRDILGRIMLGLLGPG